LDAEVKAKIDQIYTDMTEIVETSTAGLETVVKGLRDLYGHVSNVVKADKESTQAIAETLKDVAFAVHELTKRVQILEAKASKKEE